MLKPDQSWSLEQIKKSYLFKKLVHIHAHAQPVNLTLVNERTYYWNKSNEV